MGMVAATLSLLAVTQAAAAAPADVDEAADALRSDPVYVDPDAERQLSTEEADLVRAAIRDAGTPIYVAVLPDIAAGAAGGDPSEVARQLASQLGRPGTYAVVVGDSFRAGSTELPAGRAAALAREALEREGDETAAVLRRFVDDVGEAARSGQGSGSEGDGSSGWLGPAIAVVALGGGAVALTRARRRRREAVAEAARADAADRQMLKAELSVLADDVLRFEADVRLHPEARADFDAGVSRFRAASAALDYADDPVDMVRVSRVVDEARYLMDRVRAIVAGREPPHPPEGLRRPGGHGEPAIDLDDRRQPVYVGYPGAFGPGWFGGAGSLFGGLLLGSALFGPFGFGGWGHTTIVNAGGDDGGFGGGDSGDFGGGDFGDFGGGDFGGGDFGGGDF